MWRAPALASLAGLLAVAPCAAQRVELEPSAVSQCVTVVEGAKPTPEYPFVQFKGGSRGRVKVMLDFAVSDSSPAVTVLEVEGDSAFEAAVTSHASELRVPCLTAGSRVRLQREYVFQPDDRRIYAGPSIDVADEKRRDMLACMRHVKAAAKPAYPSDARRRGISGRVMAVSRFEAADRPPVVQVYALPSAKDLASEVEDWLAGMRMPCHEGEPVTSSMVFIFRFEEEAYGFKPMTLLQFMGATKNIEREHLQFDTTQMGCPFDVSLWYRQPFMRSFVGTAGGYDPARHALLEWLRNAQLDLPKATLNAVFADTARIAVPCVKFDLKPKEQ